MLTHQACFDPLKQLFKEDISSMLGISYFYILKEKGHAE
jgi:hypothetical protein